MMVNLFEEAINEIMQFLRFCMKRGVSVPRDPEYRAVAAATRAIAEAAQYDAGTREGASAV